MRTATTTQGRVQDCTCGKCRADLDEHGNKDYGFQWDTERGDYITRSCPVAREAARTERSIQDGIVEGWFRRA